MVLTFKNLCCTYIVMSLKDFEVLLFNPSKKLTEEQITFVYAQLTDIISEYGYAMAVIDHNIEFWDEQQLLVIMNSLKNIQVSEKMVKNRQKKLVILQMRNFTEEDEIKVQKLINDALVDYEMDVVLLDNRIKLEKASTFFNRVTKQLKLLAKSKQLKKDEFTKQLKSDKKESK